MRQPFCSHYATGYSNVKKWAKPDELDDQESGIFYMSVLICTYFLGFFIVARIDEVLESFSSMRVAETKE